MAASALEYATAAARILLSLDDRPAGPSARQAAAAEGSAAAYALVKGIRRG